MKTIASERRPGGVSRSIDYLRSSLINPDPADEAAKPGAVIELSELMIVAINQAASGDAECGYFLAELLAYLWKRRSRLDNNNETFDLTNAPLGSLEQLRNVWRTRQSA